MLRTRLLAAYLLAAGAASSGTAQASPLLPENTGIHKLVQIDATAAWHQYPARGGGGFLATIDAVGTIVWCVDNQNYVSRGQTYYANVTLLSMWPGGMDPLVRKGTNTTNSPDLGALTPLQRYQAAAWLLEQYTGWPYGPTSNTSPNTQIQDAVWRLTYQGATGAPAANSFYSNALAFISNPANAFFGLHQWAVVSGNVTLSGTFSGAAVQTFLVRVVPEPATFVLLGAGFIALGLVTRKRNRKRD